MNPKDFKAPAVGRVLRIPSGYHAFVPAKLPPKINYSAKLTLALSKADAALSELAGLGRLLPNPHLLIGPLMRREAVVSSRIEGTQASLADILLNEAAKVAPADVHDMREVNNYVVALEHGIERLPKLPLSLRLVLELHERLMKGVRGEHATPGEFRKTQNWIGPVGSTLTNAAYVPPPVYEMHDLLGNWETFLHVRDAIPDLIQCAVMHEQFESIHPFIDGNGRVGRLLITLFLVERERLKQPLLYLSDFIEQHRREYYESLQKVRTHGDWEGWLLYFLHGVAQTGRDAANRAAVLMEMRETYRRQLKGKGAAQHLLDALFENPFVTVARAASYVGVSAPTAANAIGLLQEKGILSEISGRKWGRIYRADRIFKTLEAPIRTR